MKKHIVIVVENGLVESVYADTEDIDVEIIDLDTDDPDRKQEAEDSLFDLTVSSTMRVVY